MPLALRGRGLAIIGALFWSWAVNALQGKVFARGAFFRPDRFSFLIKGEFARTLARADDLHELACLARDARDAKLEGFMRGEEVQPTGRITARIACYQHAVDWDEIDSVLWRSATWREDRPEPGGRRKATG